MTDVKEKQAIQQQCTITYIAVFCVAIFTKNNTINCKNVKFSEKLEKLFQLALLKLEKQVYYNTVNILWKHK